jgi:hypothetical protein
MHLGTLSSIGGEEGISLQFELHLLVLVLIFGK